MDTLALLCNLYGDGPQTLRRLREAGCGTLASLETLESERLASLLRTSVRSAKRFQAEARLLRERSECSAERTPARRPSAEPVAQRPPPKNVLVASVLSAWRERDARVGDGPPPLGVARSVDVPRAPLPASGEGLEGLDGMDAALLARLRESGIDSLAALREADVLDLAGRRVAGFTRLLHLQFLARRTPAERLPRGGIDTPEAGGLVPLLPAALPRVEAGTPGREAESQSRPGVLFGDRLSQGAAPSAADVASAESAVADARPADLLVPARAQERRGGLRPTVPAPVAAAPRFSPRTEPSTGPVLPLEAELERHAAARRAGAPLVSGMPAHDDAGSSGPFA